jgi:hypothetical protein
MADPHLTVRFTDTCKLDFSAIEALLRDMNRANPSKVRFRDTLVTDEGSFVVCRVIEDDFADSYVCTNGARTLILNELHLSFGDATHYRDGREIAHFRTMQSQASCREQFDATPMNFGGVHSGGYTGKGDPNMRVFDSR